MRSYSGGRRVSLHHGDCLDVLPSLEADSVDTCITDPPYGLEFMGKDWDHGVPGVAFWQEVYRVLKPGAMLLAFGGTRTHHRLMVAIEDAGFEIRDCMMWLYAQGFPKSHDISKAIDKAAGAEREVVGQKVTGNAKQRTNGTGEFGSWAKGNTGGQQIVDVTAPATAAAQRWDGWGTALKPAWEPIIVAMKPIPSTFADNALKHGVAGLWIDGGRVHTNGDKPHDAPARANSIYGSGHAPDESPDRERYSVHSQGRWPANVILDEAAAALLDEQSGERPSGGRSGFIGINPWVAAGRDGEGYVTESPREPDTGGASRFFYCAKSSRSERNEGLEGMTKHEQGQRYGTVQDARPHTKDGYEYPRKQIQNHHPTVKPLSLLKYLCKLTKTPTGGVVLDPFMGSGSTGCAAVLEGRDFIGIELEAEYMEIAERRIEHHASKPRQLELL